VKPPGAVIVDPLTTPAAATVALVLVTAAPPSAIAPEKVPEAATATATPTATESSVGFVSAGALTAPVARTLEPATVALPVSLTASRATDTESATLMPAAPAATETEAATAVVLIVAVSLAATITFTPLTVLPPCTAAWTVSPIVFVAADPDPAMLTATTVSPPAAAIRPPTGVAVM